MAKVFVVGGYQEQSGVWGVHDKFADAKKQADKLAKETSVAIYTLEMGKAYTSKEICDGKIHDEEIMESDED